MDAVTGFDSTSSDQARDHLRRAQAFLIDAKKRLAAAKADAREAHVRAMKVEVQMEELRRRAA
jgi:hypothetical protein